MPGAPPPSIAVLHAPAAWQAVDFISDLHLQASDPATFARWSAWLGNTTADAVFILGDLFEVWVGDDVAAQPGFEADCVSVLRAAARKRPVYVMHGNRDFLLGAAFATESGVTLLDDPCALVFGNVGWLLSHGDALCLDDGDYQRFRAQVRSEAWQLDFLSRPLERRQAIARGLRDASDARRHSGVVYGDVDAAAARAWLGHAGSATLIHGHTHRPADHDLGQGLRRVVLSDWDCAANPARAQVLRLSTQGLQRLPVAGD